MYTVKAYRGYHINKRQYSAEFTGKFNFSNFQRIINFTVVDFPELYSLDLEGSEIALCEGQPSKTISLDQVSNANKLKIRDSINIASSSIHHELFSATFLEHYSLYF